ncbi:MAG: prolyl oligopeptidase family serine peptidase [Planctomycetes bacterium]|nr:prolyl oligopeptidase family serine peptidase [Planctomycetota bacterium]
MKAWLTAALLLGAPALAHAQTLLDARKGFETKLQRRDRDEEPLEAPPAALFSLVRYRGPAGELSAYLGKPAERGRKHPAIIWITGGFPPGGIGAAAWQPADPANDQSAQAYRRAGVVMMYPTVRGSFGNGGVQEAFLGEVDDVLAALEHLRGVEDVDPERIYLGGHSTGGTLALLVAAATDRFRAVFAFGPVADPATYGQRRLPYDARDAREGRVRAPVHHLAAVRSPTFVIEGEEGNIDSLRELERACKNPAVRFLPVAEANHFDVLAPVNALIARRLVEGGALRLDPAEVQAACDEQRAAAREADDLDALADLRRAGAPLSAAREARYHLLARERPPLQAAAQRAKGQGFTAGAIEPRTDRDGEPYFTLVLRREVVPRDLDAVFKASAAAARLARAHGVQYGGWDAE